MKVALIIQTLVILALCTIVHVKGVCVVGFCKLPPPDLPSVIFTLSVAYILSQSTLYPCCLKKLHAFPLFIFEVLMALLITNIAVAVIWTPLVKSLLSLLEFIASKGIMKSCTGHIYEYSLALAIIIFLLTLYATDTFNSIYYFIRGLIKPGECVETRASRESLDGCDPDVMWYT